MKKITFIITLMTIALLSSYGQNAGNTIDFDNAPATFENFSLSTTTIIDDFTIEMWIKPTDVQANQKLINNVNASFVNGFILGMDKGQIDFELFDSYGEKEQLKGGTLKAGNWQHVAITYNDYFSQIRLYINGEFIISESTSLGFISKSNNDLVLGMASWDKVSFGYKGEMDEVRYWSTELSSTEIKNYMNLEAFLPSGRGQHPRQGFLRMYLKCDEPSGNNLVNTYPTIQPSGSMTTRFRKVSTVPFKGIPAFVSGNRTIGGVWEDKSAYALQELTLSGVDLNEDQSAVIEANISTQDYCNTPVPDRVTEISCLRWHLLAQNQPSLEVEFNLEDYNLFGFKEIVLLESDEVDDFSDARIISGSAAGGILKTNEFTVSGSEKFYAIGFLTQGLSVDKIANSNAISVYPNPSNGKFTIEVKDAKLAPQSITVIDATGQEVLSTDLVAGSQSIDLSSQAKGIYFIRIATENGNYSKRVTIF
jgi:hypothetical protein